MRRKKIDETGKEAQTWKPLDAWHEVAVMLGDGKLVGLESSPIQVVVSRWDDLEEILIHDRISDLRALVRIQGVHNIRELRAKGETVDHMGSGGSNRMPRRKKEEVSHRER